MTCPTCKGRCRVVIVVVTRGPAFGKPAIRTTKLPEWAFAANDNARTVN